MKGAHEVLITASGNLLVKIAGNPNEFIYITPQGHYLASKYEKVQGCANNHIEWGALIKNSRQQPKSATPEQIKLALAAIEKRKGLLAKTNVADRMQWVADNRIPKPEVTKTAH